MRKHTKPMSIVLCVKVGQFEAIEQRINCLVSGGRCRSNQVPGCIVIWSSGDRGVGFQEDPVSNLDPHRAKVLLLSWCLHLLGRTTEICLISGSIVVKVPSQTRDVIEILKRKKPMRQSCPFLRLVESRHCCPRRRLPICRTTPTRRSIRLPRGGFGM